MNTIARVGVDLAKHVLHGAGNLNSSTLLKAVNAGEFHRVPFQLRSWTKAGGKEFAGLRKRREREIGLFFEGQVVPKVAPKGEVLSPLDIRQGEVGSRAWHMAGGAVGRRHTVVEGARNEQVDALEPVVRRSDAAVHGADGDRYPAWSVGSATVSYCTENE